MLPQMPVCLLEKILRDFLEIENLQVTKKDIYRFYNNAILNLEKSLREVC